MKKLYLLIIIFAIIFICSFLFVNHTQAAPTIYYDVPTDIFYVNDTCDSNLSGWLYDYDVSLGLGQVLKQNPYQYEFLAYIVFNVDGGGLMYVNDSNKQIVVTKAPASIQSINIKFNADVVANFSHIDFINNYTGSTGHYFMEWSQDADTNLSFWDCNFNSFASVDSIRLGSATTSVSSYVNLYRCSMNNMYIQRAQGDILNSDFKGRTTGAPILNYNTLNSEDINVRSCPYAFQGVGTPTIYGLNAVVSTALFYSAAGTGTITMRDTVSNTYTLAISTVSVDCYVQNSFTGTVYSNNGSLLDNVFVNVSENNLATGDSFTQSWQTSSGVIPLNYYNYTYRIGSGTQVYLYHIITVEKSGYIPIRYNVTLQPYSNWTIILQPIPTITVLENLANATGTNVTAMNTDTYNWTIWNNYTGYNGLIILEQLLNTTGTNQSYWNGTHWFVFNNYTGNETTIMDIYPDKIFNLEYTYYIAMDKFDDTHYIIAYRDGQPGAFDGGGGEAPDNDGDGIPDTEDTDDDGDGVPDADDGDWEPPVNETSDGDGRGGEGYGKIILCTILPTRNETQFSEPIIFATRDITYIDVSCFNSTDFVLSYNNGTSSRTETIIGRTYDYSTAEFGSIFKVKTSSSESTRCLALNETNFVVAFPISTDGIATVFNRITSWNTHTFLRNITFTTSNNPVDIRLDNFNETHFATTFWTTSNDIRISISETVGYTRLKEGRVNASTDYYNMKIFNGSQIMIAYNAGGYPLFLNISSYDIATNALTRITNGTVLNPEPTYVCGIAFFNETCGVISYDESTNSAGGYNGTTRAFVIKYDNFNWTVGERLSNPEDTSFITIINITDHRFAGAFRDLGKSNYGCVYIGDMKMTGECGVTTETVTDIISKAITGAGIATGLCLGLPIGVTIIRKKRRKKQ